MNEMSVWPHRWFGFWAEDGSGYAHCPSVVRWPLRGPSGGTPTLRDHLERGQIVCVGQVPKRACALCGEILPLSRTLRSDGIWLWPHDLVHYVDHGVVIPEEMIAHFRAPERVAPVTVDPGALDWP
jgi:hypothetical protein